MVRGTPSTALSSRQPTPTMLGPDSRVSSEASFKDFSSFGGAGGTFGGVCTGHLPVRENVRQPGDDGPTRQGPRRRWRRQRRRQRTLQPRMGCTRCLPNRCSSSAASSGGGGSGGGGAPAAAGPVAVAAAAEEAAAATAVVDGRQLPRPERGAAEQQQRRWRRRRRRRADTHVVQCEHRAGGGAGRGGGEGGGDAAGGAARRAGVRAAPARAAAVRLRQLVGFSSIVLRQHGFEDAAIAQVTASLGGANLVVAVLSGSLMDRFGRRPRSSRRSSSWASASACSPSSSRRRPPRSGRSPRPSPPRSRRAATVSGWAQWSRCCLPSCSPPPTVPRARASRGRSCGSRSSSRRPSLLRRPTYWGRSCCCHVGVLALGLVFALLVMPETRGKSPAIEYEMSISD